MSDRRLLVPLSESITVRQTVGHAVRELDDSGGVVHLVVAVPYDDAIEGASSSIEDARELVERAEVWAREDASDDRSIEIETAVIGTEEYLFGPRDYAEAFAAYATDHDVDRIVLDPEYRPGVTATMLQPLERELGDVGLAYEEAPVERPARHERLVGSGSLSRLLTLFVISYGFYLVLGDPTYPFDLVTGAAVAGIVAYSLSRVTFATAPTLVNSPLRVLRFVLYVPYLLWEIVKANVAVSLVILRPSMPIDPRMTRVNVRVRSGLPLLALANSITLTPGTLTVRANDQRLVVHSLTQGAREDLFEGGLERAIRFVFSGRDATSIPTPRDREDTEVLAAGSGEPDEGEPTTEDETR